MSNQVVTLQLVRVKCVDETGGRFAEKFGNDEMALSAVGVDARGDAALLEPFEVGANFDDGESRTFNPPKALFTLAVPEAGSFPKTCTASLILAEDDIGTGHRTETEKAFEAIKRNIAATKADMVAAGEPTDSVDWGEIAEKVINATVGDDVFPPRQVSVAIASPDFRFGNGTKRSDDETAAFSAHAGKYEVVYNWLIEPVA